MRSDSILQLPRLICLRHDEVNLKLITKAVSDGEAGSDDISSNLQFAAAVAEFSMLLRNSEFRGSSTYDDVLKMAGKAKGKDQEGYRTDFLHMVESAKLLHP